MSEEMNAPAGKKKLSRKELAAIRRENTGKLMKREARTGLIFISPWIAGALIFLAYPLITSFYYALNNIRITPIGKVFTFVGQGNFTEILLADPDFGTKLINYILKTIISVPVIVSFALIIALMLNENIKGRGFFRVIFFIPVIIVSGPILGMLSSQDAGTITAIDTRSISSAISAVLPKAVAEPISELFENMVTMLWYAGVPILLFLSGLQKIDKSMYEAAQIDGGSEWECFWKITLPTIKPLILLSNIYTIVFISNNDQNEIIGLIKASMFSGIQEKGYGYASAMAWMYSIVVLLIVGLFALIFLGRKDKYERQVKKAQKMMKKEKRELKKARRRDERNVRRIERSKRTGHYSTYGDDEQYTSHLR